MVLHHIGIVVDNLEEAVPLFETWFKAKKVGGVVEDEAQGARIQLFLVNNDTLLEIVTPIPGVEGSIHKSGEFHLCYTVPDLDAEMARLHDLGAMVSHPTITAKHFDNNRMGFLVTHSGQLVELLEDPTMVVQ